LTAEQTTTLSGETSELTELEAPAAIETNGTSPARSLIVPDGLGFKWETGHNGITFMADRIVPYFAAYDLQAEVRVLVNGRHVHMSNYVITKPKDRELLAEMLCKAPALQKWDLASLNDWRSMVEQFCTGVQLKQRSRIELNHTSKRPKTRLQYIVDDLVLKTGRPNLLFAPGGAGKSYLMCAICVAMMARRGIGSLTVSEAKPVYFDWEEDFDIFEDRVNTVCRGYGIDDPPAIPHARMRGGTIADQINEMAKILQNEGSSVGIIDSMSAAAGTTAGGGWEVIAQRVFDALGLVPGVTWIIIGHVTKLFLKEPSGTMWGCYSDDTEVLTKSGWKLHQDIAPEDVVLSFNAEAAAFGWEHPTQKHVYEYDGPMMRLNTQHTDVLVTPNHRMVVRPAWGGRAKSRSSWEFARADSLARSNWHVPYSSPVMDETPDVDFIDIAGREYPADALLRLIGWWVSDGHVSMNGVCLTQAENPIAQRMRGTLDELGFSYSWHTNHYRVGTKHHDQLMCMLRCRDSRDLAHWLIRECGDKVDRKRLPQLVFDLSLRQRNVVLDALLDGDGSRKARGHSVYCTTSRQLSDDVQRLALSTGHGSQISKVERPKIEGRVWRDYYIVAIASLSRDHLSFNGSHLPTQEMYHGTVYCLTVPSGAYVTRRNGKCAVQGNSIQIMNRASNAWEIRSEQEPNSSSVHLKLYDAKWNHTGKRGVLGLRMDFYGDQVRFASESPEGIPENLADRMVVELMGGTQAGVRDLAAKLGVREGSVRTAKSRYKERFLERNGLVMLNPDWSGLPEQDEDSGASDVDQTPAEKKAAEDLPW
jgi:AAA domain